MKKIPFISLGLVFLMFVSCKEQNNRENNHMMNDSVMMNDDSTMTHKDSAEMQNDVQMMETDKMYSCSMHPEVQGKKEEKCSECGMALELTKTTPSEKQE
jgi:hypothetical protein